MFWPGSSEICPHTALPSQTTSAQLIRVTPRHPGASALHLAIAYHNNDLVNLLLKCGTDHNQRAIGESTCSSNVQRITSTGPMVSQPAPQMWGWSQPAGHWWVNLVLKQFTTHISDPEVRRIKRQLLHDHPLHQAFSPFTTERVIKGSKESSKSTAAYPDDLTMLHLKHSRPLGIQYLAKFFNPSIQSADIPSVWKQAKIKPILFNFFVANYPDNVELSTTRADDAHGAHSST